MLERDDVEAALLALAAAVVSFALFANGYFGPTGDGWRLYLGALGVFAALRVVEAGAERVLGE